MRRTLANETAKTVIPIAGGKGGVGKTLIAANLGAALAMEGHPTILVDLDFGNSNLHTLVGLANRFPGVGDYVAASPARSLATLAVETDIPNLKFIPGDGRMPFLANMTHSQKQQIIRDLKTLSARYILLDLGAGSSFNVIDLFSVSDRGLVITTPEFPSTMSMLVFLKNLVFRMVDQELKDDPDLVDIRQQIHVQSMAAPRLTVAAIRENVRERNPSYAERI
ncbi:MAG: MinD/ParA family protein, partial [Acidobacteria bacterium]